MGKINVDGHQSIKSPKPSKNIKKKSAPLKITYISSPVTVKVATASEFRSIVQELTGKDSDIWDDEGPQETSAEELSRPVGRYVSELLQSSVEEEDQFFGSVEDMEVCFLKDYSDGFMGLISPLTVPLYNLQ